MARAERASLPRKTSARTSPRSACVSIPAGCSRPHIATRFLSPNGSWNRSTKIGYRVMLVRLKGNRPVSYEVFAEGWLAGDEAWGRPVDVQVLPDGSLLVSDDHAGAIYRITYRTRR